MTDSRARVMILQTRFIDSISGVSAQLLAAFPSAQYRVTLVYLEAGDARPEDAAAERVVFLGLKKGDYKGLRLKALARLRPFLRDNAFDLVIANMYKPVNLLLQLRRHLQARACIGIIHGFGEFDRPLRRWVFRRLLEDRWHLVGVSEPVRQYLIDARCGLHPGNTSTIHNAVDADALALQAMGRNDARRELGLGDSDFVVGTLGRSVQGKGHEDLLEAFALFARQREDARLVIIGDGPLRRALTDRAAALGLQERVRLPGHLPEGFRYLRALDLFVFPSRAEGFGLALLEAMALGLPVLVNRVAPLTTLVDGVGRALDTGDHRALAEALAEFSRLPAAQRQQLGEAHCARAQTDYGVTAFQAAYRNLARRLLAMQ